jgi:hypothetical protein
MRGIGLQTEHRGRVAARAAERSLGQVIVKRVAPFPPGATRSDNLRILD